jgi:hypothetical protein
MSAHSPLPFYIRLARYSGDLNTFFINNEWENHRHGSVIWSWWFLTVCNVVLIICMVYDNDVT